MKNVKLMTHSARYCFYCLRFAKQYVVVDHDDCLPQPVLYCFRDSPDARHGEGRHMSHDPESHMALYYHAIHLANSHLLLPSRHSLHLPRRLLLVPAVVVWQACCFVDRVRVNLYILEYLQVSQAMGGS